MEWSLQTVSPHESHSLQFRPQFWKTEQCCVPAVPTHTVSQLSSTLQECRGKGFLLGWGSSPRISSQRSEVNTGLRTRGEGGRRGRGERVGGEGGRVFTDGDLYLGRGKENKVNKTTECGSGEWSFLFKS